MNTRKLFQAATNANKARVIVINKMDADNVDLAELVSQIQETFGSNVAVRTYLQCGQESAVIDCIV